jgi:succinoglycan biosynthesis transport protein ExoP
MENYIMNDQSLDQLPVSEQLVKAPTPTPWEILWQRKSYVALGIVVGVALGVLYWSMAPRVYETTAQIWVLKKRPDVPLSTDSPSLAGAYANAAEDFLSTHRTLIHSAVIIGDAVSKGRLTERPTFRASSRPAYDLGRALKVTRDRDKSVAGSASTSQILSISFRCSHPEDCAPVLTAVIASYQEFLKNRTEDASEQTLKLIEQARNVLEDELVKKEKARDEFISKMPALWKTQYGTTLYQARLVNLDAQRTSLNVQRARLRAALDAVDTALKEGRSQAELLDLVSSLPGRSSLEGAAGGMNQMGTSGMESSKGGTGFLATGLEGQLIALQLEEGSLLDDYGPEHPRVKSLRDRMQTIRGLLTPSATTEAKTPQQRDQGARATEHLVALRITQLKQDLAETERSLRSLDLLYDKEMSEARKIYPHETQEAAFTRAIKRSQDLFDSINQRLRELSVVRNSQGFETQVITPPTEVEKVAPVGSLILALSSFLGLVLGGGLAYLAEFTDKSFRSPEDVRRRLGLPIMGVIPLVKPQTLEVAKGGGSETAFAPTLFAWHRPKSREAEAYRGVRTALYFSTHGQGRKVIQITSPNQGDGKSTLAANLAVSIAQTGKSVLIVDADLRRPQIGKLFGAANPSIGFASVLGGLTEPTEAICPTAMPGLFLLPAGPTPSNPAELLTGTRLREVLEWLRERYDYVLVDSPPLLAVTDPGVLGPQVDGVIMTLRTTGKGRIEAKRAKEILANLGVNIFGVVLNALDQTRSYYGSYGYYYGYGYGYHGQGYYKDDEEGQTTQRDRLAERIEKEGAAPGDNGTPIAKI